LQGAFLLAGFEAGGTNLGLIQGYATKGAQEPATGIARMDGPFFVMVKASGFAFDEDDFSRLALRRFAVQGRKNGDRAFPAAAWALRKRGRSGWVIRPGGLAIRTNKSGARHGKKYLMFLRRKVPEVIVVEIGFHGHEDRR
jgi:hypothetical protein